MKKRESKTVQDVGEVTDTIPVPVADAVALGDSDSDSESVVGEAMSQLPTDEIIRNLRGQYGAWEPVEGEYRKRLHRLLGAIYEAIPIFESDSIKRNQLEAIVRKDDAVVQAKNFEIMRVDALDLLLVSVLSHKRETSATRSQWRAALLNAGFKKVEHNAAAFQHWINKIGGMVKAAKGVDETDEVDSSGDADGILVMPKKFNLDAYLAELSTSPAEARLDVDLNPKVDLFKGLGVLLVYTSPDDPGGPVQLVEKVGDEGVVKRIAKEVASGNFRQLSRDEQLKLHHEQHLWAINRVALILAGRLKAKFDLKTLRDFRSALTKLTTNDQHEQRYFKGYAGVAYSTIGFTNLWTLGIENPEFLDVDPGRYFKGGREGALIPYDVSSYGTPEGDAAIKEYISANTEPWGRTWSRTHVER